MARRPRRATPNSSLEHRDTRCHFESMMRKGRGPNPIAVAAAVRRAARVRPPAPAGTATAEHRDLGLVLDAIRAGGLDELAGQLDRLGEYKTSLAALDPDAMGASDALAFWLNLYNAGALALAGNARSRGEQSVLRVPGAFTSGWVEVAGETLSLHDIEHGKIRRFRDPRIHGGLVCDTASCPTIRFEPYVGPKLDSQLDDQMRSFLASGGATIDKARRTLHVSRIFLWYGGDFTRPQKMPTWLPAGRKRLVRVLARWFDAETREWQEREKPKLSFHPYDWELACSVA
jgi:hypothetical protein